mgnify:FL=1|jgi:hypothetical protein
MASLPYPRCPPNSFHRTHSKFVCASPPTELTEFTEASGGEEPPTDFTDVHRFFFSASRFCVFCVFRGRIVMLVPDCFVGAAETAAPPKDFCENLCNLWEALICQKVLWVLCNLWEDCNVGARLLGWCTSCSGKRQSRVGIAAHLMDNLWVENKKMELNGIVVSIFFVSLPREYPNITN